MNILLHSNVHLWEEHLAQMVELGLIHKKKEDKIFVLFCKGEMKACPANYHNNTELCLKCINQQNHTVSNILKDAEIISIKLGNKKHQFPLCKSIEEFKKIKYEILPAGKLSISTVITHKTDTYIKFNEIKKEASLIANNAINLYNFTKKIIKKNKIDIVYSWNGRRSSDGPILYAAKNSGIKYFSYISGGEANNFKIQETLGIHNLEYSRNLIENFYKSKKKIKNYTKIGNYFYKYMRYGGKQTYGRFIYSQLFNRKNINLKSNKKILLIFTSSYWEFFSLHDNEWSKIDQFKILRKVLSDKNINNKYKIIVRWHPNQRFSGDGEKKEINKIIQNFNNALHYDYHSEINSYKLIEKSNIVLSFGSTIGIEATYYRKPSVCFGSAFYDKTGGVYVAKNYTSLKKILLKQLKPLPKINAIKFGYHEMKFGNINYKNLRNDKFNRWFYEDSRLKKHTLKSKIWETLVIFYKANQENYFMNFIFLTYRKFRQVFLKKATFKYKI